MPLPAQWRFALGPNPGSRGRERLVAIADHEFGVLNILCSHIIPELFRINQSNSVNRSPARFEKILPTSIAALDGNLDPVLRLKFERITFST